MVDGTGHNSRRLIIHLGVQKTASTAFHHFAKKNRDALSARLDVLIPEKRSLAGALGRSAAGFSLDPALKQEFVANILLMRDNLAEGEGTCLISHENLPGAMLGRQGVTELYPVLPQVLELLDEHLAPFRPEYAFYTREMKAWKRSVYNQAVKSDACAWTFDEFLEETKHCGDWGDLKKLVMHHVGENRAHFFRLEDETQEGLPGLQLLRHAGLIDADIAKLEPLNHRPNVSLNEGALEFVRLLNLSELPPRARKPVVDLIIRNQPLFVRQREGA